MRGRAARHACARRRRARVRMHCGGGAPRGDGADKVVLGEEIRRVRRGEDDPHHGGAAAVRHDEGHDRWAGRRSGVERLSRSWSGVARNGGPARGTRVRLGQREVVSGASPRHGRQGRRRGKPRAQWAAPVRAGDGQRWWRRGPPPTESSGSSGPGPGPSSCGGTVAAPAGAPAAPAPPAVQRYPQGEAAGPHPERLWRHRVAAGAAHHPEHASAVPRDGRGQRARHRGVGRDAARSL